MKRTSKRFAEIKSKTQDQKFELSEAIKLLKECDYEGLYLEKNRCLIINKEKTIALANQYKIFISTCDKIE